MQLNPAPHQFRLTLCVAVSSLCWILSSPAVAAGFSILEPYLQQVPGPWQYERDENTVVLKNASAETGMTYYYAGPPQNSDSYSIETRLTASSLVPDSGGGLIFDLNVDDSGAPIGFRAFIFDGQTAHVVEKHPDSGYRIVFRSEPVSSNNQPVTLRIEVSPLHTRFLLQDKPLHTAAFVRPKQVYVGLIANGRGKARYEYFKAVAAASARSEFKAAVSPEDFVEGAWACRPAFQTNAGASAHLEMLGKQGKARISILDQSGGAQSTERYDLSVKAVDDGAGRQVFVSNFARTTAEGGMDRFVHYFYPVNKDTMFEPQFKLSCTRMG